MGLWGHRVLKALKMFPSDTQVRILVPAFKFPGLAWKPEEPSLEIPFPGKQPQRLKCSVPTLGDPT